MRTRVLILASHGRDAEVLADLLTRAGRLTSVCASLHELAEQLEQGAGVAVITEESISGGAMEPLATVLDDQPPWSDFPFILLSTKRTGRRPADAQRAIAALGNVVILERPIHGDTLISAVASALRGRRRQYQAGQHLDALKRAERRLKRLNTTLEQRILRRTDELTVANNRLTEEIAERERAQAALAQAQKMEAVGQLTGGIAHDFNNLLTVISGNLELIALRTREERTRRQIELAQQAADRAGKLTQQLLVFARSQRLSLQAVDLNGLIRNMADLLARTIGSAVTVDIAVGTEPLWATTDPNQFELAVLNLAINARDAMTASGSLRIAAAALADTGRAQVTVADTGTGIPPHLIDKVFNPFFTTKATGKGTGLGLAQVYAVVQQSGGSIELDSTVGVGTTFTLDLPLAQPPTPALADAVAARAATPPNAHVLVVDDDDGVRRFIVETLETTGYRVTAAASGSEGLSRFAEAPPDVLVVDFAMPEMNGVDFVRHVIEQAPGFPVVMATGYADMAAVDRIIDRDFLLQKPFRTEELLSVVARALADAALSSRESAA